jgi:hypothetical protein
MIAQSPPPEQTLARRKLHTALVLASVALVFFIGFVLRGWVLSK